MECGKYDRLPDVHEIGDEDLRAVAGGTFAPDADMLALCQDCGTVANLGNPLKGTFALPDDLSCPSCGGKQFRICEAPR